MNWISYCVRKITHKATMLLRAWITIPGRTDPLRCLAHPRTNPVRNRGSMRIGSRCETAKSNDTAITEGSGPMTLDTLPWIAPLNAISSMRGTNNATGTMSNARSRKPSISNGYA